MSVLGFTNIIFTSKKSVKYLSLAKMSINLFHYLRDLSEKLKGIFENSYRNGMRGCQKLKS